MRFFARLVLICNICFLIAIGMRFMSIYQHSHENSGVPAASQPLIGLVLVMYFVSVLLNTIFLLICTFLFITRKHTLSPKWLFLFNILIWPLQVYYFFYS
jgi:hypothetical protein